jgi:signal transduction histidine kinase
MPDEAAKRNAVRLALLAIVYTGIGKLGLGLDAVSGFATLVWPPSGLAFAALLVLGRQLWPGVWLGAFVVNVWTGASWPVAAGIATGNTLEAVAGAYVMRTWFGFRGTFDGLRQVMGLAIPVALGTTTISATIGVACLALGKVVTAHGAVETWLAWWVGDMLGALVVAPLLLTWSTGRMRKPSTDRLPEVIALTGSVITSGVVVFFGSDRANGSSPEAPYVLLPLFVWAAVRFELRGATTATALASALAVWGTARGKGPFVRDTLTDSLLALQTFMGCAALTPLVVAGAISDRARAVLARENFVAAVSHDLRNPLNAIRLSAASLMNSAAQTTSEQLRRHDDLVRRSVDRMARLIADLSDAAAVDAGHLSVELREEDAQALMREAVELSRPLASAKRQSVVTEGSSDITVRCDRGRILQVLSNLIGNAMKFSNECAQIVVCVTRTGHGMALFSVRDHGVGIDASELSHVFDRYWHARHTVGGGTGLGLFLVKGIVEAHCGRAWAESELGVGSTFYFTLPLFEAPASRPVRASPKYGSSF